MNWINQNKEILNKLKIISIKNFYKLDYFKKIKIKNIINKNYDLYYCSSGGFNFPIKNDSSLFFDILYEKFLNTSVDIFGDFKLSFRNSRTCHCYRGNKNDMAVRTSSWWHNHINSSTINSVYYLEVYNDGITFAKENKEYNYLPKNGELLIFPSDLIHAAQPNRLQKFRYSVNMEIVTEESTEKLFNRVF